MTLKEKLTNAITIPFSYENKIDESIVICEQFAIDFLSWTNTYKYYSDKTNKELLEIYKKEKKL